MIVAQALTDSAVDDASTGIDLIETIASSARTVTADAAYDTLAFYETSQHPRHDRRRAAGGRQPSCPDATRGRALAMGRSERSARLGAVDGRRRSAIIDRPASRTRSSGTSRFSAIDFEVGLAQRKLSNRCLRATCSIE